MERPTPEKNSAVRRISTKPRSREGLRRPSRKVLAQLQTGTPKQKGHVAAIEMESEEIFVGKDVVEATLKGWEKYPGQAFYFVRIGSPAVHSHKGRLRKR